MSVSDCDVCKKLLDEAAEAIKAQLAAITNASAALQNSADRDFDVLNEIVKNARLAQVEACQRYENHLASHASKVMAAGGCQAQ